MSTDVALPGNDLESILESLARYGAPMLTQFDDGDWFCKVNMRVNATGVKFEVQHRAVSPLEAARVCHANMVRAIASLGK